MSKDLYYLRCGQCGKEYTKAQWRRQQFWCDHCKKYVCYECIGGYPLLCPACAGKVKKYGGIAFVGFAVSIIFLPLSILFIAQYGLFSGYIIPFIVTFIFIIFAIIDVIKLTDCKKIHRDYISKLPPGIIPPEERVGYNDIEVQEKIKLKRIERGMTGAPIMRGALESLRYGNLKGNWNFPVLSREERIAMSQITFKNLLKFCIGMLIFGCIMICLYFFIIAFWLIVLLGIISFLFSLLLISVGYWSKKQVQLDALAETKVAWKTRGYETTYQAIEDFLHKTNRNFTLELDESVKKLMWQNPKRIYKLNNIRIESMYSESKDGRVYGWVAIQYKSKDFLEARKLHEELDEYLIKQDLIMKHHI